MPDPLNLELLERMTLTAGVPGREHRMRELVLEEIDGLFDEVSTDPLGSVIAVKKPNPGKGAKSSGAPTRVMIAAHMDQIGFLVSYIDDKGFLTVNPVGGFDTRNLFARLVTVCPDLSNPAKDLPGLMNPGSKPIHIATPEERKKVPTVREFVIDLGLPAAEVKRKVKLGDMVVLQAPATRLGKHFAGQCLDNRVACWAGIELARKLKNKKHACELTVAFTVQEEVGLRGAMTSGYIVRPDIGIGLDTTLAVDTPGVSPKDACTKLGEGVSLTMMDSSSIGDYGLIQQLESIATAQKIKTQRSILSGGGTDTAAIQRVAGGCRAMTLSVPTRYIHTVTEMVHTADLKATRDLLVAFVAKVD